VVYPCLPLHRALLLAAWLPLSACRDSSDIARADDETGLSGSSNATTTSTADDSGSTSKLDSTTDDDNGSDDSSKPGFKFDLGDLPDGGAGCAGAPDATLTGTVWGPNGEIPVSGALVYTSAAPPPGIPQHVYCAECEQLGCDAHFTTTEADGSFSLPTNAANAKVLVVQKGQFMRVSPLNVGPGPKVLDDELTTLPDRNEPENGLYIPLIAIGNGSHDRLEDALGKFGLADTMIASFEERTVPGTESFDLWDNGRNPTFDGFASQGTFAQLVSDPDRMNGYHIIFVPCSSDVYLSALSNPQNVQNIRDWVAAGGRWYVADWANEWINHVFPNYQTLQGEPDNADLGSYDSLATVLDPGLLAWLETLPAGLKDINPLNNESHPTLYQLPQLQTRANFSVILDAPPVFADDGMGGMVDVGHKVWLEGPGGQGAVGDHPLTVTGQFGCGKIQFTSYHTAQFFNYVGLSPQELVLIYTILEIGVCQDALPPPPG
jgi:hypothetical protein